MSERTDICNDGHWPDDNGVHINAHGGGVLYHDGVYYWYGEHKIEGTAGNVAHVGVHCYSSSDLSNWNDEGIALAVSDDPESDIVQECVLERPKVIHCAATGKFVMWFHLELRGKGYGAARSGVASADSPTGPFTYQGSARPNAGAFPLNVDEDSRKPLSEDERSHLEGLHLPGGLTPEYPEHLLFRADMEHGQDARDMTLFVDDDGSAYHIYSSERNGTLHVSRLSDDYMHSTGHYVRIFPGRFHEAPAICKRQGRYWLLASGCSSWNPNAARSAVADHIFGPWEELGNPCVGTNPANGLGPAKTFGGQSTYILPVHGHEDLFIAMFDIWRPDNAIDGRYVWLPIQFSDSEFTIEWQDAWSL